MNYLKHPCLVIAVNLALTWWFISPSIAQLAEAEKLNEKVHALYQAGKYAEAIPLAQQELAIREKVT
jgi:hypothetical protein